DYYCCSYTTGTTVLF
nr:immunoglobulin light chain junction region [Macaca mulatta]MOY15569.1 immunoglobulin light chain junction region [Macaca mulatta]MOY16187.1 immunoglobulin light chain junction region [Macaca mulatta]MOY16230.1 immunoglobulin light chain junction region [Macaca mulatta]MOY16735.1 immunoglobulin light chain junction region [Macaca mulatta]